MKSNDMQAALRAFLDANPDLPEGESAETTEDASTAPPAFRLDIILEKKGRGGKQATIISGWQDSDEALLDLAATLKKRLATGGSARGGEILIQGDRRKDVLSLLKELGYKARII